jgi:hypothetical protein
LDINSFKGGNSSSLGFDFLGAIFTGRSGLDIKRSNSIRCASKGLEGRLDFFSFPSLWDCFNFEEPFAEGEDAIVTQRIEISFVQEVEFINL